MIAFLLDYPQIVNISVFARNYEEELLIFINFFLFLNPFTIVYSTETKVMYTTEVKHELVTKTGDSYKNCRDVVVRSM